MVPWPEFEDAVGRQIAPYLTTGCAGTMAAPLWCGLGCCFRTVVVIKAMTNTCSINFASAFKFALRSAPLLARIDRWDQIKSQWTGLQVSPHDNIDGMLARKGLEDRVSASGARDSCSSPYPDIRISRMISFKPASVPALSQLTASVTSVQCFLLSSNEGKIPFVVPSVSHRTFLGRCAFLHKELNL